MAEYRDIRVSVDGRVGIMTLDSENRNSVSLHTMEEMRDCMEKFEKDDNIRCVMFTHAGPDFSIGCGDEERKAYEAGLPTKEVGEKYSQIGGGLVAYIERYPKPTLAAGKGLCYGGTAALFEVFDVRLVGESFQLYDGDIYWGMATNWGVATLRLPLWLGRNKLMDFLYFDEFYNARQLYELGIVSRVVADDYLPEYSMKLAQKMAKSSPAVVAELKKVIRNAIYGDRYESLRQFELESAKRANDTEDYQGAFEFVMEHPVIEPGVHYEFKGR